ncbi:segregation/condensation protein A [Candidatus Woesearchaeota archaeon]|nr:segregation/condensation protein A [Candidatus Woesearchaeota archaeon]
MLDDLYNLIVNKDEITWQSLLMDLIKSEEMDPWDIDVSLLARKYLDSIKEMQKFNFFVSGKMILASALLLRIKSDKFMDEDIAHFDNLMYPPEELDPMEMEAYLDAPAPQREKVKLTIKTPQARKRRVTLSDLMGALQKALEVNQRKVSKKEYSLSIDMEIPVKEIDITALIKDVYSRVVGHFETNEKGELTFSMLVKSDRKEDKILTILPLLHLDNDGKVELNQVEHFGDIYIKLNKE